MGGKGLLLGTYPMLYHYRRLEQGYAIVMMRASHVLPMASSRMIRLGEKRNGMINWVKSNFAQ